MLNRLKPLILYFLLVITILDGIAQREVKGRSQKELIPPPYYGVEDNWIDEHMSQMSLKEKIGQLFMVAAYSNKGKRHIDKLMQEVENYNLGGIIFFQGSPYKQAKYNLLLIYPY